jgi:CubicO group peptidase (beta-lactamase class C family)
MAAYVRFHRAHRVLEDAVSARVAPCAVAEVGRASGPIWSDAVGRLTYDADAPAASPDTIFDLASLTKVLATTTIALTQLREGRFRIDRRICELTPHWKGADREEVTTRDLLEHCSGLPAHRKYYQSIAGRDAFERAICAEALAYPPRSRSVYSDPGFMLLGFLLEDAAGMPLDAQFDRWKADAGIEEPLAFRPPAAWRADIAPTEIDPWRGRLLVGEVHDENAAALDGVAAHAGLFGTAAATGACARWWLAMLDRSEEARLFVQRSTVPGSSRALGWDTMLPISSCGTRLSPRAFGHTGFTGTSLWIDPARDLYLVLLTNRVHPTRDREGIQEVRRAFHDAVVADIEDEA